MNVDFYASASHYFDHLAPTWLALDANVRGRFFASPRCAERADRWGVPRSQLRPGRPGRGTGLVVVASHRDLRACRGRPIVLAQHGAGQAYSGDGDDHPAYAGGRDNGAAVLFLCPNEVTAERWRAAYPSTPAVVVGCPKLDGYAADVGSPWRDAQVAELPVNRAEGGGSSPLAGATPTVAVSWHWDYDTGPPEGRWAFPHYAEALADLRDGPWKLLGHGHPRAWRTLSRYYAQLGIEAVRDFDEVLERADLYACDNSSTIYEFAATGRPVVLMNAPWYRKSVEFGLRFWRLADVGLQCDGPITLNWTVAQALADPHPVAERRAEVVREVYGELDGKAAERAARAIEEVAWATRSRAAG